MKTLTRSLFALALALALLLPACADRSDPLAPLGVADTPTFLLIPVTATQVSAGSTHTCAVQSDGTVRCWGLNAAGQSNVPGDLGEVRQISAGWSHTCAIQSDGALRCWGNNTQGQSDVPGSLGDVRQVSVGNGHTCAVGGDGSIACWGRDDHGQSNVPGDLGEARQVSAGNLHTCAVRSDGTARCWGLNAQGQSSVPAGLGEVIQVSTGNFHSCAVRSDGTARCWGRDLSGESSVPAGLDEVEQISAGGSHTCAVRSDGSVRCWGLNVEGQSSVPAGLGEVVQVSAGGNHTCAVQADGIVACWGSNSSGQSKVPTARVLPQATFSATPTEVVLGSSFAVALDGAEVPGHPEATDFTYAFDCGDGSGYGAFGPASTASCAASTVGARTVGGAVRDQDGDEAEYSATVHVAYAFAGFLAPVQNPDDWNLATAGRTVPLRFSLNGFQGMDILAENSPRSTDVECGEGGGGEGGEGGDPIGTPGQSGFSYDPETDIYQLSWRTERGWAGTCRELVLELDDGILHTALFEFR
jgi:hypothetical protein